MAAAAAMIAAPLRAAPPATAEEALARQQAGLQRSLGLDCDRGGGEDIIVCGRQGPDPHRLPLPVQPEPGARIAGEPPDPDEVLALHKEKRCTTTGPNQQCSGGLPILPVALWLLQTAVKAAEEKD